MKKIVLSLLIVLGVILLTGCGKVDFENSPRIVCSKTETDYGETTNTKFTLLFDKNDKLTDFKVDADITYNQQMSQEALEISEKAIKAFDLIPGIKLESSTKANGLTFSITGKAKILKKLMRQLNKDYDESKITGDTKQEALEEFTGEGYTCETFE